jgi:hypothetical protein
MGAAWTLALAQGRSLSEEEESEQLLLDPAEDESEMTGDMAWAILEALNDWESSIRIIKITSRIATTAMILVVEFRCIAEISFADL